MILSSLQVEELGHRSRQSGRRGAAVFAVSPPSRGERDNYTDCDGSNAGRAWGWLRTAPDGRIPGKE